MSYDNLTCNLTYNTCMQSVNDKKKLEYQNYYNSNLWKSLLISRRKKGSLQEQLFPQPGPPTEKAAFIDNVSGNWGMTAKDVYWELSRRRSFEGSLELNKSSDSIWIYHELSSESSNPLDKLFHPEDKHGNWDRYILPALPHSKTAVVSRSSLRTMKIIFQ